MNHWTKYFSNKKSDLKTKSPVVGGEPVTAVGLWRNKRSTAPQISRMMSLATGKTCSTHTQTHGNRKECLHFCSRHGTHTWPPLERPNRTERSKFKVDLWPVNEQLHKRWHCSWLEQKFGTKMVKKSLAVSQRDKTWQQFKKCIRIERKFLENVGHFKLHKWIK